MEKEDHQRYNEGHKVKNVRYERRSANGVDPDPKKGGYGGWGKLTELDGIECLDENDPNYDEENH
jgi:hypothetical protein